MMFWSRSTTTRNRESIEAIEAIEAIVLLRRRFCRLETPGPCTRAAASRRPLSSGHDQAVAVVTKSRRRRSPATLLRRAVESSLLRLSVRQRGSRRTIAAAWLLEPRCCCAFSCRQGKAPHARLHRTGTRHIVCAGSALKANRCTAACECSA